MFSGADLVRWLVLLALVVGASGSAAEEAPVSGDLQAGRRHYVLCAACHGPRGGGNQALDAPALAGREDWYLIRQLENFRSGVRGTHSDDIPGQQMRPMALTLPDDNAVRDVVGYLVSLGLAPTDQKEQER